MKLLLAEDEKRMASALVEFLKIERYEVDHVEDGDSALAHLETNVYDGAIIDVMMPRRNGFDVMDYGQEDYVFGSSSADARHWNTYVLKVFEENAETLSELFNK